MLKKRAERIENINRMCASITEQAAILMPLVRRYLPLSKNIRLCGGPLDEPIQLNLRISDWRKAYGYCRGGFGHRVLGMNLCWIDDRLGPQ